MKNILHKQTMVLNSYRVTIIYTAAFFFFMPYLFLRQAYRQDKRQRNPNLVTFRGRLRVNITLLGWSNESRNAGYSSVIAGMGDVGLIVPR